MLKPKYDGQINSGFDSISGRGVNIPHQFKSWITCSPFPQQAIADLENLLEHFPDCLEGDEPGISQSLAVLGYSHFLSRRLIRHPGWVKNLRLSNNLEIPRFDAEL